LVARKGGSNRRVVISAHIDAKDNTPGALDNAASVVVLLLLAELLKGYDGKLGIELVPFNGEDHYSAAGEKAYLKANEDRLNQVLFNINLDALGSHQGKTVYSFYEFPEGLKGIIEKIIGAQEDFVEGQPWFQSDHMVFVMNGVPALAITSENFVEILTEFAHTPKDNIEKVDCNKIISTSLALHDLLMEVADP
jgi:aminopeptidase YwaD